MRRNRLLIVIPSLLVLGFIAGLVRAGYRRPYTGFGEFRKDIPANVKYERAKTLWDWLQLLVIPSVLALGGFGFQRAMKKGEEERALEAQRGMLLQSYLERMSNLVLAEFDGSALSEEQRRNKKQRIRSLAKAETLSVLVSLGGSELSARSDQRRRGQVIRFLLEGGFIKGDNLGIGGEKPFVELAGADLRGIPLSNLSFSGIDLSGVDLRGADLRWARLHNSNMNFNEVARGFAAATFATKIDPKWELVWKITNESVGIASLAEKDLRDADLSQVSLAFKDLRGTDLRGALLDNVNLLGAELDSRTKLDDKWRTVWEVLNKRTGDKILTGLDLSSGGLFSGNFSGYTFKNVNLLAADLTYAKLQESTFHDCPLLLTKFDHADLTGVKFLKCHFFFTSFVETALTSVDFTGVELKNCDFTRASLQKARFNGANLQEAKFVAADLQQAQLLGADLSDAVMDWCNLRLCEIDEATKCEGRWRFVWNIVNSRKSLPQLREQNLSRADLRGVDLRGQDLTDVDFSQTDLRDADLRQANLTGAKLVETDLRGAKLDGVIITEELLKPACLSGDGPSWNQSRTRAAGA